MADGYGVNCEICCRDLSDLMAREKRKDTLGYHDYNLATSIFVVISCSETIKAYLFIYSSILYLQITRVIPSLCSCR